VEKEWKDEGSLAHSNASFDPSDPLCVGVSLIVIRIREPCCVLLSSGPGLISVGVDGSE
jgi:hypothetical protein